MGGESGGLAASVRRKLDDGQPAEQVLQELVARGMSQATAERFLDRALAAAPTPAPAWIPSEPVPSLRPSTESPSLTDYMRNPRAVEASQAKKDLIIGALMFAVGMLLTLGSGAGRVWIGLLGIGLLTFGRGVVRSAKLDGPFRWKEVLALPAALVLAYVGYLGWTVVAEERAAQDAVVAQLTAADASRANKIREESALKREKANLVISAEQTARLDAALTQLTSKQQMAQCEAATVLGQSGSEEYVRPLVALMNDVNSGSRHCAAGALVDLGETTTVAAVYVQWVQGANADLYRSALIGFGEIGPSAADVALPYLTDALKSTDMGIRYLAVESLTKLGPAGRPLLEVAAGDVDPHVRDRAAKALAGKR